MLNWMNCDNRIRYLRKAKERLVADGPRKNLPREGYITIEGYDHICDKIRHMLLGAESSNNLTGMLLRYYQEGTLDKEQLEAEYRLVEKHIQQEDMQEGAFLIIDIDDFKSINDTWTAQPAFCLCSHGALAGGYDDL